MEAEVEEECRGNKTVKANSSSEFDILQAEILTFWPIFGDY
jgi:hypothetical protein